MSNHVSVTQYREVLKDLFENNIIYQVQVINDIRDEFINGRGKVSAIKICYHYTGLSLVESKNYVEKLLGIISWLK